ncbi:hypothetical protein BZG23_06150 [Salinivibrio sp. ML290]|nr:hypothetical protein BZG23_06150 [Salinivibrio sp. ML290]
MFSRTKRQDESDRLLSIMKTNRDRVTVSANGVVRVNLQSEDVKRKIRKDVEKLRELKESSTV